MNNESKAIDWLVSQLEENGFLCIEGYEEEFEQILEKAKQIKNEYQGIN